MTSVSTPPASRAATATLSPCCAGRARPTMSSPKACKGHRPGTGAQKIGSGSPTAGHNVWYGPIGDAGAEIAGIAETPSGLHPKEAALVGSAGDAGRVELPSAAPSRPAAR